MSNSTTISFSVDNQESRTGINHKRLLLWLVIVSIVMVFAAMTSAYIVSKSEGGWFNYTIPSIFTVSCGIILISSVTMHLALIGLKRKNSALYNAMISMTLALGGGFLYAQIVGWQQMPLDLGGDSSSPSVSFFYMLSGLHWAHIIIGLLYIIYTISTVRVHSQTHTKYVQRTSNCAIFWHFLDALWLYLFVFLLINT